MPTFEFTSPEGKKYRVEGPDGATQEQAFQMLQSQLGTPQAAPERGLGTELARQVGLTVRGAAKGAASLPGLAADAAGSVANFGLAAYDKFRAPNITELVTGKKNGYRFPSTTQAIDNVMTSAGVARPENAQERVVQDVVGAMSGTGSGVALGNAMTNAASPVVQGAGRLLAAGPAMQTAAGVTSAGAQGITRESGGSGGAQAAAALLGAVAPQAAVAGGAAAVRGLLRGGEEGRQTVNRNIQLFQDAAGTMPSVGQATEARIPRAMESVLAKTPGSAGVMQRSAQQKADAVASSVSKLADELSPTGSAVNAGEAITKGVQGFRDGFKTVQARLYDTLDQHIPQGSPVSAENTKKTLAALNEGIEGAPALSEWFKNTRIKGIEGALRNDTEGIAAALSRPEVRSQAESLRKGLQSQAEQIDAANAQRRMLGMRNLQKTITPQEIESKVTDYLSSQVTNQIPYESIKKLRTLVGNEIADNSLLADVPRSKWAALYKALSDDLGVAAKAAGPEAEQSWKWANKYTSSQLERLEQLSGIVGKDAPEKVFSAAMSGTKEGNTVLKRVVDAIPKENRKELASAVLRRMGRATSGNQNELGDVFSTETFLTNLNNLSPDSRATLFGRLGLPDAPNKLAQLAGVASNVRDGSKVFANPSGTQPALSAQMAGGAMAASALSGNLPLAAAAGGSMVGANLLARRMTNPEFVKWLGQQTQLSPSIAPAEVNALSRALNR